MGFSNPLSKTFLVRLYKEEAGQCRVEVSAHRTIGSATSSGWPVVVFQWLIIISTFRDQCGC